MATKKKQGKPAKRMAPKILNKKRLMANAPEELEHIWDEEASESWNSLKPKQQDFFIEWVSNGYNATKAYSKAYNNLNNDNLSGVSGHQLLRNPKIQDLAGKLSESKRTDLVAVKQVYYEAMHASTPVFADGDKVGDFEDHKTRVKAADSLAKLNGELTERTENNINLTKNVTINHNVIGEMNQYLDKIGQKPIESVNQDNTVIEEDDQEFESFGDSSMQVVE